jgi:excinuclease UvrABC ATPase subunit
VAPGRCETCGGADKLEAHHEDYRRPLEVTWLCTRCHGNRHREINELIRSGADLSGRGF